MSALLVIGAIVSGSPIFVTVSAVVAVVLGAAATRITHSELMQSRRDAGNELKKQAQAYAEMTTERTEDNRRFAATMADRIMDRQRTIHQLENELSATQKKVAELTLQRSAEARRADVAEKRLGESEKATTAGQIRVAELTNRVTELEQRIDDLKAELAAWEVAAKEPARKHA